MTQRTELEDRTFKKTIKYALEFKESMNTNRKEMEDREKVTSGAEKYI